MLEFIDEETLKHTAQYQTATKDLSDLIRFKTESMKFVNMMDASSRTDKVKMLREDDGGEEEWPEEWPEDSGGGSAQRRHWS